MKFDLIRRSLLWLAGMALPATPLLQRRLRYAIKALICAVSGALVLSAVFIGTVVGVYFYLLAEGVSPFIAFGIVASLGIAVGAMLILFALRQIEAASYIKDDLSILPMARAAADPLRQMAENLPSLHDVLGHGARHGGTSVRDIATAFVDGLINGNHQKKSPVSPIVKMETEAEVYPGFRANGVHPSVDHPTLTPLREEHPFL